MQMIPHYWQLVASHQTDLLTYKEHVRGIGSHISQRIGLLRLVKRVFSDTSVLLRCYYAFVLTILEYCSLVCRSAAECHLQLLDARCIR